MNRISKGEDKTNRKKEERRERIRGKRGGKIFHPFFFVVQLRDLWFTLTELGIAVIYL